MHHTPSPASPRSILAVVAACLLAASCGSKSPTGPTPPTPAQAVWTLSGSVTSSVGGVINGAVVAIVDGPDAGKQQAIGTTGRFTFTGLHQAGFTVRASASGYIATAKSVTLTANATLDFVLPREPVAVFSGEGFLEFEAPQRDGGRMMHATGTNTGDGCGTRIAGTSTLLNKDGAADAFSFAFDWTLDPTITIRPGERFVYRFGPIGAADFDRIARAATGTYLTDFRFTSAACQ